MSLNVGHVIVTFTVNGKVSVETPVDMELRQQWGQHDLMFVRLVVPKGKEANLLKAWPDGSAVAARWGQNPGAGIITWYGYINHHAINTSDDATGQNVQVTYVLIGTSKVMNPDKNRTWTKYTITAMAQKMAKDYSFRCVVTQSSWILNYEVQANESDFAFMNRMADKVGFRFWVSGGTLYCIDPIVLLAGQTSNAVPTYTINKDPYTTDPAQDFEIAQGDSLPGSTTLTRTVYGVDMHTPGYPVFKVQPDSPVKPDSPSPSTTYQPTDMMITSSRHVTSRAQAKQLMNANQALTQFWVVATVQVFGNTLLYPGKSINLKGTAVPNNNNMGWIVTAADHSMVFSQNQDPTRDRYVTRLTIVTNQKTSTVPHINGIHQIAPEIIGCTLAGNIWHSATQNVVIEGIIPS